MVEKAYMRDGDTFHCNNCKDQGKTYVALNPRSIKNRPQFCDRCGTLLDFRLTASGIREIKARIAGTVAYGQNEGNYEMIDEIVEHYKEPLGDDVYETWKAFLDAEEDLVSQGDAHG